MLIGFLAFFFLQDLNRFPSPPPLQMDSSQGQETESSKQNKKAESRSPCCCQQNVRSLQILVSEIVECDYVVNLFVEAVTKPPFSKQETKQEISEKSMVWGNGEYGLVF